jgi:trk system potassium uptake protein TrkA
MSEIDFLKYPVQPVTVLRSMDEKSIIGTRHKVNRVIGILTPETILRKNDILVLFGETPKLEEFIEQE